MTVTVTANLTDITLGESADSGDWTGTDGTNTENFRQGAASEGWLVGKSTNDITRAYIQGVCIVKQEPCASGEIIFRMVFFGKKTYII